MAKVHRPNCAGYYELGDVQCDGHADRNEPACRYRDRCHLLIELGGGPSKMGERDPEHTAHVLDLFDEDDLDEQFARRKAQAAKPKHRPAHKPPRRVRERQREIAAERASRETAYTACDGLEPSTPTPTPRSYPKHGGRPTAALAAVRVGRPTPVKRQAPRPVRNFGYTLPIADTLADNFAHLLEARRIPESDAHAQVGDVYLHYTRHSRGRRIVLFRCIKEHKTQNHRIASIWLRARDPWVSLTLNVKREHLLDVMNLRPPRGVRVSVPEGIKFGEEIEVEGVTPELVIEVTRWLVRVYLNGLIPMSRVKVKR